MIERLEQALEQDGNQSLRPAKPETLDLARKAGFPDEPASWCVQLGSDEPSQAERRLHCIAAAIEETFDNAPGVALVPLGYVTFALSNGSGDAYCIDTNVTTTEQEHPVTPLRPLKPFMRTRMFRT